LLACRISPAKAHNASTGLLCAIMPHPSPFPFLVPRVPPTGGGLANRQSRVTGVKPNLKRFAPMTYSLGQAAKATGKSKMTIQRAIQKNVISATRNANGSYTIDPSELHRVFDPIPVLKLPEPPPDPALLKQEIEFLREKLAERDKQDADKNAVIDDLRRRLDQEGEERRKTLAQLTALLTDQREPLRRSWWPWW